MLRQVKQTALWGFKRVGGFDICRRSRWRQQRLIILCYHGISLDDEHLWNPMLYMQVSQFEARLRFLADAGYTVLPLGEALTRLYANDLPPSAVVITFDDGHYDFYAQAYPVIRKFGVPVTLYLTSFYTDYNRPIFDGCCSYLLWKARHKTIGPLKEIGLDRDADLRTEPSRLNVWRAVKEFTIRNGLDAGGKDHVLQLLAGHVGVPYEDLAARRILHNVTPSEVTQIARDGVSVQLHTHRHRTPRDRDLFIREIRDNRARIKEMTGLDATHFCYPSGVYRLEFLDWLKQSGVVSATTCDVGLNDARTNPLLLSRLLDHSGLKAIEFEGWLTGFSAWTPHRTYGAQGLD